MLLLEFKARNLLAYSQITKEFPVLLGLVDRFEKITSGHAEGITDEEINFLLNMLPSILKQAQAEWVATGKMLDLKEVAERCKLCNTKTRYLFYIRNKLNGTVINVGRECIKEYFDDIKSNIPAGMSFDTFWRLEVEKANKLRRLQPFYDRYPGAMEMLAGWKSDIERQPILIPADLEKEYMGNYYKGQQLIKQFKESAEDEGDLILDEFGKIINRQAELLESIKKYVIENESNEFIVTKEIENWLKLNNKRHTLDILKKTGFITIHTFYEIWEPNFLNKLIPSLNKLLHPISLKITGFNDTQNVFYLDFQSRFKLQCSMGFLMLKLGPSIFRTSSKPVNKNEIISECTVLNEASLDIIINELNQILEPYNIKLDYYNVDFNDLIIIGKKEVKEEDKEEKKEEEKKEENWMFKVVKLVPFIKKNKNLVLNTIKPNTDPHFELLSSIRSDPGKWYPIDDYSDYLYRNYQVRRQIRTGSGINRFTRNFRK